MASGVFEKQITAHTRPGSDRLLTGAVAGAANIKGDEYIEAFGTMALNSEEPARKDALMWVASCTKLITTICALQCVERGLFTLDSPEDVENFVPEVNNHQCRQVVDGRDENGKLKTRPAEKRVTLRHLLTHQSGFGYDFWLNLAEWRIQNGGTPGQSLSGDYAKYFDLPLEHEHGEGWAYGVGLDIVGLMIGRANKTTLRDFMAENVFKVLDMHDSAFSAQQNPEPFKKLLKMTGHFDPDKPLSEEVPEMWIWPTDRMMDAGGIGLFTTVPDYMKVLKSLLHNDGHLLRPATVDMMFEPQLSTTEHITQKMKQFHNEMSAYFPFGIEWQFGLGGQIGLEDISPRFRKGFLSWAGAPCLRWWIDRAAGVCGIFATQLLPSNEPKQLFLGDLFEEKVYEEMANKV